MKQQRGFTLIELLVVITILGIMSAVGLSSYRVANQKARDSRRAADIQQVRSALEMWRSDCGSYPAGNWTTLQGSPSCSGVAKNFTTNYLGGREVKDPKAGSSYVYLSPGAGGAYEYDLSYTKEIDGAVEMYHNP